MATRNNAVLPIADMLYLPAAAKTCLPWPQRSLCNVTLSSGIEKSLKFLIFRRRSAVAITMQFQRSACRIS
jgi:hypothetical protein